MHGFICIVFVVHVPQEKKDSDKTKQFAAGINLDKKSKDQSGALHSPFNAILHHKSTKWKTYYFRGFYKTPYKEP